MRDDVKAWFVNLGCFFSILFFAGAPVGLLGWALSRGHIWALVVFIVYVLAGLLWVTWLARRTSCS